MVPRIIAVKKLWITAVICVNNTVNKLWITLRLKMAVDNCRLINKFSTVINKFSTPIKTVF